MKSKGKPPNPKLFLFYDSQYSCILQVAQNTMMATRTTKTGAPCAPSDYAMESYSSPEQIVVRPCITEKNSFLIGISGQKGRNHKKWYNAQNLPLHQSVLKIS